MTLEGPLTREAFLSLAKQAGLDVGNSAHMEELYRFVQATLAGLQSLQQMDVSGAEPDVAFVADRAAS